MDPKRFDEISRQLATGTSRRSFVKGLTGGVLGGALMLAGRGRVDAKASKVGICHHTGSASNPIVQITVSTNAVPAHLAHGDTLLGTTDDCSSCGDACSAPENGTAFCGEGGCGFTCDTGYEPDGNGGCVAADCSNAFLSGPGGSIFCVDDEIHVFLNGELVLGHDGTTICYHEPVSIGPVANGDLIKVVATNSPVTCGDVSIDPISLTCADTGVEQILDAVGIVGGTQRGCGAVFYDETFTVAL